MKLILAIALCLLVASTGAVTASENCLALAVYKEAGNTSQRSQRAVLDVLENRMRVLNKSACQIVRQPFQWSWYSTHLSLIATNKMLENYYDIVDNEHVLPDSAMWFHNKTVKPKWARNMVVVDRIDGQIFYRNKHNG